MRIILQLIIFILVSFVSKSNAQETRLPTASEKASVKKNFPVIFQNIPTNFEKLKKGTATDYFGQQLFESSTMLLPENIGPLPQRIYYITEKDGKRVNTYNEELPFSAGVCIELLDPLLKQNGLIEVAPARADSNVVTKSFKGKNGVVIFSVNPFTQGTIITIGKPYYYYENESKSIATKSTLPVTNNSINKAQNNTEANKKAEERIYKALTKLYKSATNTSGSFRELKTGQPEKVNEVNIYDIKSQLQIDSLQSAFLLETEISNNINGVSIDISGGATANYITALNKMAKSAETAGEVYTEKKTGVTRYSLLSKSQKQEIIYLLDFDYPEYNDRLICAAIYTFSEPAVTGNNKTVTNEEYKNYTALPPANPLLLETEIQLGLARIITKQANLEGSFDSMRIGTPKKLENEEVYDIVDQLSLPNIAEAQLFVAKNEKGTRGVVINIDPAITSYYISAAKGMTKDPVINKEIATVTTEKSNNGGTKYIYKSLINDYKLFLIIDYPDSKKKDDLLFFSVY